MIRGLVFDWYGVCTKEPWRVTLCRDLGAKLNLSVEAVMLSFRKCVQSYEEGHSNFNSFISSVLKDLACPEPPETFHYLLRAQPELDFEVLSLIRRLKTSQQTFLFSDNYFDVVPQMQAQLGGFNQYFDNCWFSCEAHITKRELGAYQSLISKTGLKPSELIFIDDQQHNLSLAEQAGIKGLLYRDLTHLIAELKAEGIVVKEVMSIS